jgi:hypothetical protein
MKRTLALTIVLCLAAVALLGVGASPAAAATCVDCHAAPPAGPPAPHGVLVAAVTDCATCHKGMSPHATLFDPADGVSSVGLTVRQASGRLTGRLVVFAAPPPDRAFGISDVVVYLQQRLWGATAFTDLGQATTVGDGLINPGNTGTFAFTVPSPTPWAAYRAVAEGDSEGWRVRLPQMAVWLPKPELTLTLSGLKAGVLPLGRTLKVSGAVAPTELAGKRVVLRLETKSAVGWERYPRSGNGTISASGTYSWTFTPKTGDRLRIRARFAATPDSRAVITAWRYVRVK